MTTTTHGLTAYDTIYLQLAVVRSAEILPAGAAIAETARRAGVTVQGD